MADNDKYIVKINSDLIDLAPVLMDSLVQELTEMQYFTEKGKLNEVREKAHSSRGAALTFGFEAYAHHLLYIKEAVKNNKVEELRSIYKTLGSMLNNVNFIAAE